MQCRLYSVYRLQPTNKIKCSIGLSPTPSSGRSENFFSPPPSGRSSQLSLKLFFFTYKQKIKKYIRRRDSLQDERTSSSCKFHNEILTTCVQSDSHALSPARAFSLSVQTGIMQAYTEGVDIIVAGCTFGKDDSFFLYYITNADWCVYGVDRGCIFLLHLVARTTLFIFIASPMLNFDFFSVCLLDKDAVNKFSGVFFVFNGIF